MPLFHPFDKDRVAMRTATIGAVTSSSVVPAFRTSWSTRVVFRSASGPAKGWIWPAGGNASMGGEVRRMMRHRPEQVRLLCPSRRRSLPVHR
jgi:hypothetical protein